MDEKLTLIVHPDDAGKRLDHYLATEFPGKSRSFLQKLVTAGEICVNGDWIRKSYSIAGGDLIQIDWPKEQTLMIPDDSTVLSILYEDDDVMVIDKPPGLVIHPGAGHDRRTLVHALLNYNYECFSAMVDQEMRPGIVHRLDKDTTGVMVVAKSLTSKQNLVSAFRNRHCYKVYLAIVNGIPNKNEGKISTEIARNRRNRKKMAVVDKNGKFAETNFHVIATGQNNSLLKLTIATGRTHQIRVHMAHINHPVIGDSLYGSRHCSADLASRQMLHAWQLEFPHPRTNERCRFVSEIPGDMLLACEKTGIELNDIVAKVLEN